MRAAWTDEADAELRRLQAEGYSGGRIAELMGKTRNAVIGRLHRLQLPPQMTRHRISNPKPRRPPPPRADKPSPATARRSTLTGAPVRQPDGPCTDDTRMYDLAPEAGGVLWTKMTDGCRYPMNAAVPISEHRVCHRPRAKSGLPGDPYCSVHSLISMSQRRKHERT